MPNDLSLIFNIISRDGASPVFKTVAAEAKALAASMADADAKMSASTRTATAEINASLKSLNVSHKAMTDGIIRDDTGMAESTKVASTAMSQSMARVVEMQRVMTFEARAAAAATGQTAKVEVRSAEEVAAANSALASKMSVSMGQVVAAQKAAATSAVEMGATVDRVSAEEAAATEASAAKRKASMMAFGAASAAALVGVAYYSVKAAVSFEASMARVQTMAGASSGELKRMSDGILNLAPKVGIGPDKLAESLYHVESAGFSGAKALDMVTASAKLSALGQDDINSSTQAVVATLASNIKGVRDANDAAALILHTVGTGDMTMHQFTQALGTGLLATAAAVGLSFRDVGAAIATMTDNAIPADQAATKLRTSLLMMVNPSGPASAALASIGMNATALAGDLQKPDGLKTALDDIRTHLDATFPKNSGVPLTIGAQRAAVASYRQELATAGVQGKELDKAVSKYTDSLKNGTTNTVLQEQAFAKMFGGSKNAGTMLVLFNEQLDRMNPKLASYGDATSRAAQMQEAWAKQQDTFKQKLNQLTAAFDVMKIKIGNALLPVLKDVIGFMGSHIGLVEALAVAIGTVLVAATVAWTISLQTNPIVLFVEALVLVGVEIYELVTHFKQVTDFLRGPWGQAITFATIAMFPFIGIPLLIFEHWGGIVKFFKGMWHDITEVFSHPSELASKIIDRVKEIPGAITSATTDAANWLWGAAKRVAGGLWDGLIYGITHAYGIGQRIGKAVADAIGDLGKSIAHFLTHTDWGKVFGDVVKGISDFFTHTDWGKVAGKVVDALTGGFSWLWKNKATVAKIAGIIVGGIFLAVLAIPAALLFVGGSIVAGIVAGIYSASKPLRHAVGQFFTGIWDDIKHGVSGVIGFISAHWRLLIVIFAGPLGFVVDLIYKWRKKIGGFFEGLWHDVTKWVSRIWHDVTGWFSRMWNDVTGWASRTWHDVTGWFSRMWHDVTGWVSRLWHDVTGWFDRLWQSVTAWVARIWHDVTGWFDRLWHDLVDTATRLWHDVTRPFSSLWDGLKQGFNTVVGDIEKAWDRLHDIFAAPIKFLVRYVYDDAIVPVWNGVAGIIGENNLKINKIDLHGWAEGGGTSGPWRGDDRIIKVGGNEHIWTAAEVDAAGGHERVAAIRSAVLGRPVRVMGDGPGSGYIFGGGVLHDLTHNPVTDAAGAAVHALTHNPVTDALGDVAKAVGGFVRGALADGAGPILNAAVDMFAKLVPNSGAGWGKASVDMGHGMINKLMDWIRGQDARDQAAMGAGLGGNDWNLGPLGGAVDAIIAVMRSSRIPFHVNSTYRADGNHRIAPGAMNDPNNFSAGQGYHSTGNAVDFGSAPGSDLETIAGFWADRGGSLLELIYGNGWQRNVHDGQSVGDGLGFYGPATMAEHGGTNSHVHVAAKLAAMENLLHPVMSGGAGGGVQQWAGVILRALQMNGLSPSLLGKVESQMQTESGGNRTILQQVHDINSGPNAARGLMQVIPTTFAAYHVPGTSNDIFDALANVAAALNYAKQRYGPGLNGLGQGHGYANGGMPPVGEPFWVGERGPELLRLGPGGRGSRVYSHEESRKMTGSGSLMHVENMHIGSDVDFEVKLRQSEFRLQTANGL